MLWWTLRRLKSLDTSARFEAVNRLAADASPRAIEARIETLSDLSPVVADAAAEVLGRAGNAVVEPLCACLRSSPNPDARRRVVSALSRAGGSKAVETLTAIVSDPSVSEMRVTFTG